MSHCFEEETKLTAYMSGKHLQGAVTVTYIEGLNAEFMQRWLSVEQDNISIHHVTFHDVPSLQFLCNLLTVTVPKKPESKCSFMCTEPYCSSYETVLVVPSGRQCSIRLAKHYKHYLIFNNNYIYMCRHEMKEYILAWNPLFTGFQIEI